ncbi:MAG: hypothetical protein APF76_16920 [Desulfitibacter sp. BRH_c19]|nr:MAG: hypothetical protein APF76_16920 [Desulfitibacter sp. BRH_c19]
MSQLNYVKSLKDITRRDFENVGGKGANLGEMIQAGLPVPEGFVVQTSAYRDFIKESNLNERINSLVTNLEANDIEVLENVSEMINKLFQDCSIPKRILDEINAVYENLYGIPVAIRSSATAEDLPGTSFAGQYDTFLNITGIDNVYVAIKKCWASLWNARALSYRLKYNVPNDELAHGVVVQKLVSGEKSGILFTANPLNDRRDQMLINASRGLGEAIVGGEVTPDQWTIKSATGSIEEVRISIKEFMTVKEDGGTCTKKVPEELQNKPVLNEEEIKALVEFGRKTEQYFGCPQDIEWTLNEGIIYLVQSRPITSLFPMPTSDTDSDNTLRIYLNFNLIGQGLTEPFTPMGQEIWRLIFSGYTKIATGKEDVNYPIWFKVIAGRIFIDMTDLMRKKKAWNKSANTLSTKDPVTSKALLQWLEKNEQEILKGNRIKFSAHLIKVVVSLVGDFVYGMLLPQKARKKVIEIGNKHIDILRKQADSLIRIEDKLRFIEKNGKDITLIGFKKMAYIGFGLRAIDKAESLLIKWNIDTAGIDRIKQSLPYNVTTEMGLELLEIAECSKGENLEQFIKHPDIERFMKKYGHRAVTEIDVGMDRWREDPSYVIDLIKSYREHGDSKDKIKKFSNGMVKADMAIEEFVASVRKRKGRGAANKIKGLLQSYREVAGLREQPKYDIVRTIDIFRDILLSIGKELAILSRLEKAEDVFYITFKDIESGMPLHEIVLENKDTYQKELKRKSTPRLVASTGESIYSINEEEGPNTFVGIPVSPGVYEGKVRIIEKLKDAQLKKGEILVTRGTDPAWTPLFLNAGAIIMESGGPLSHGTVVAREYGIPAVVGIRNACTRLKNSQIVRVNGESGQIVIMG